MPLHRFVPAKRNPFSCDECGYAEHERLQHVAPGEDVPISPPTGRACGHDVFVDRSLACVFCKVEELEALLKEAKVERDGWEQNHKLAVDANDVLRAELVKKELERHDVTVQLIDAELARDVYKHLVELLCNSMHPHPTEHPTMYAAKQRALEVLKNGPPRTQGEVPSKP